MKNKTLHVFQFWNTPLVEAPPVVKSCVQSWSNACRKDGFEHHFISNSDLSDWEARIGGWHGEYLKKFRLEANCWEDQRWRRYSNMLRLALLSKFNGIWADSTLLLLRPIRTWLPDVSRSGGLHFCRSAHAQLLENWFLCSLGESDLLDDWRDHYCKYNMMVQRDAPQYKARRFSIPGLMFRLQKIAPKAQRLWFSVVLSKMYRRAPYFANYYSFEYVLNTRGERDELYRMYLPLDLTGWSRFNSLQRSDLCYEFLDPALWDSIICLPFVKLDWKRSPLQELPLLDEELVLRKLWDFGERNFEGISEVQ